MARVVALASIRPEDIGTLVQVRGEICRVHCYGFKLQEPAIRAGNLPNYIECLYDNEDAELGCFANVTGRIHIWKPTGNIERVAISVSQIEYISRDEAMNPTGLVVRDTFFTEENMRGISGYTSPEELFQFLDSKAHLEGFHLTHKKSFKENYIALRCHQHGRYGKQLI